MKAVGAAIIFAAASSWGILGALRLRARVRTLSALIASFDYMRGEMISRLTPIPEICREAAAAAGEPARAFFKNVCAGLSSLGERPFSDIWRDSVDATPELALPEGGREALIELGGGLGRYNIEEQTALIDHVRLRLVSLLGKAEGDREKNSRVYVSFGAAAGVFLVLLLL